MTIELPPFPEKWVRVLEALPMDLRPRVRHPTNPKKTVPVRWSVYVSNGETFGTKKFISTTVDSDDPQEALWKAYEAVKAASEELGV